ncbi:MULTISPECIES: ABC transporter permease [unclassified Rhodococcus (in: high G+C Gram-positive bacteria)]|uniref:ABC transporter permease n=1 Tax=unclassified Rhodococcus (in: high G+C Gram-positive bacteria) TaxID=192944 RepID=UPI0007BBEBB3|nr:MULTISPECIES: ABC transporter permease [unclassified Rhodococcus (in: high G+C Gram-positive bacteria)]KZF09520.1 ABC transporter [Rhodococcus sp. EPR-147]KZF11731.1 ABC transporter [Rhodococcus sp. EPR-279]OZF45439.1 ABC transporter [Rhodococcus sp. 14-1411-2a]
MTTMAARPVRREGIGSFLVDCATMTQRNLLVILRVPQLLLGATVQPLMFVLLFSYVLGGALGGSDYRQFLMGGIFTQTVVFSAGFTAIGLATDSREGIVERFHSLPMSRLAIVLGRTLTDALVSVVSIAVMIGAGFVVGWRINGSLSSALGAIALLVFFGFAMSWMGAVVGLISATAESAQSVLMIIVFPLTFISSAFIPSATLPGPLRIFAQWNPVTSVARATREAFGNPIAPSTLINEPVTWASSNPMLYSFIASIVLLTIFVPLTLKVSRGRVG